MAHFHYVLNGAVVFPIFAGALLLVAEDDRPDAVRRLGKASFWTMFVVFHLIFFPMHILGLLGHAPARLHVPDGSAGGRSTWP